MDGQVMAQYSPEFFDFLYQYCEGKLEIRLLPSGKQVYFDLSDHQGVDRCVHQNMNTNVFFGVATRDGKAGRKENIVNIPTVWCDVDFKDTTKEQLGDNLTRFPFKPSIINLSGGGVHSYWLLNEPAARGDILTVEDINLRIAYALGGDYNATEAARVLRVPGALNHKYKPPRKVKLHRIDNFHYELDDFSDLPEPPANKSSKKSPVTLESVKHGQRNATLARIAGKYIGRGMDHDEVLDLCLGWNCRCPEPQSIEDVITTVNSIIKTHEVNKQGNPNGTKRKRFSVSYQ